MRQWRSWAGLLGCAALACGPDVGVMRTETPPPQVVVTAPPPPAAFTPSVPACVDSGQPCPAGDVSTRWLQVLPQPVTALTALETSELFLAMTGLQGAELVSMTAEGSWRRWRDASQSNTSFVELSVGPSGERYARGVYTDYGSVGQSGVVHRFSPDGRTDELVSWGSEGTVGAWLQDGSGDLFVLGRAAVPIGSSGVWASSPSHASWSLTHVPGEDSPTPFSYQALALTPEGDVLIGASVAGRKTMWGRSFGREGAESLVVLGLSSAGGFRWASELPRRGEVLALSTAASGTVVGLGHDVDTGGFLFALEATSGQLLWSRALPRPALWASLAVHPDGHIALASPLPLSTEVSCAALGVLVFDAQGALRWSRDLAPATCPGGLSPGGLSWLGDDLVLAGGFRGTVDLGSGPVATFGPGVARGFVLRLRAAK